MTDLFDFLIIFFIVAIISYLPVAGPYFKLFNTMIHESGHAFTAVLTGGRVTSVSLFKNTGGLTITRHKGWGGKVLTLLAGYPAASIASVVYIFVLTQHWYDYLAVGLGALLIYSLLFWVRNVLGWLWGLSVCGALYIIYTNQYGNWFEYSITIIGAALLIQAFISCWVIFMLSIKGNGQAGDASALAEATKIPAPFWGFFFLLQGTFFFAFGVFILAGYDAGSIIEFLWLF
ncbi:M50 family metallopeptidase [Salipaludibacillus aurantiacus]|uniref:Peptidase M50B-like n=1 Tax=Salipaludibacillus aurantiacus TaxID=1601833 RepID=A0A1H9WFN8_9BACI|nr:M50 family metallopeptidase [Salipaludibacillus aurantiacus]SES32736.1 Peptidase M50B-like [Salipaludibacillus aurantiacus]